MKKTKINLEDLNTYKVKLEPDDIIIIKNGKQLSYTDIQDVYDNLRAIGKKNLIFCVTNDIEWYNIKYDTLKNLLKNLIEESEDLHLNEYVIKKKIEKII